MILSNGSGSTGTRAWERCLGIGADRDRSGSITARELNTCAQQRVNEMLQIGATSKPQTPTVIGNADLPIIFVTPPSGASAAPAAATDPQALMRDVINGASKASHVTLTSANPTMRIGRDQLDLTVTTDKAGYLTLFYLGSDGQTVDVLFPNEQDANDYVQPGTHRLPRPSWVLKAGGPAGVNQVVALVSDSKKDFRKMATKKGAYAGSKATNLFSRNLILEATGGDGCKNLAVVGACSGVYGASDILQVREVQ